MLMTAPLPTDSEAIYLANLGKNTGALVPHNVRQELKFLFRVCQQPWVADFLFNPEMNSLPALTAPHNINHAVSSSVLMTNVECGNTGSNNLFDTHLDGKFVIIPSFSVGSISVGFGIQQCSLLCFNEWCKSPEEGPAHFRFVRDDKEAAFLMVHQTPDAQFLKFELMTHFTKSKRRRIFAMFDKAQLEKAVRTERGILHPESILPAMKLINTVVEHSTCLECNSPAAGPCTCKVNLKPPSHPLDFSSLGSNMMTFTGAYEGLSMTTMSQPGFYRSAKVGTRIQICGGDDRDLIDQLSRWAISDHLKDKVQSPLQSIMPSCESVKDESNGLDVIDMALIGNGNDTDGGTVSEDLMIEQGPYSLFGQSTSVQTTSSSGILIADSLESPVMAPAAENSYHPPLERMSSGSGEVDSDDKVIDLVTKIASGAITQTKVDERKAANSWKEEHSVVESLSSEGSASGSAGVPVVAPAAEVPRVDTGGSRAISIAPSGTIDKTGEMDEKERRALLRKRRNREAAARSNLKRKQKNDSLKQALKETHEKAAQLRAKELVLREENLRLRKLTLT